MGTVFVTGHINPDLDCTASAVAYADLKNTIDKEHTYIPIRCGPLNEQTQEAFQRSGLPVPDLYRQLKPIVGDVCIFDHQSLPTEAPLLEVLQLLRSENISLIPIINKDTFLGTISINEVLSFLAQFGMKERPVYHFRVENIVKTIPGSILQEGKSKEFDASILTGAMPYESYLNWTRVIEPKPVLVVGNRSDILKDAIAQNLPAIVITGIESESELKVNFSNFTGTVYQSAIDSAECIRLLRMSVPIHNLVNADIPHIQWDDGFEEAKHSLINSDYRGFPVFSEQKYKGIVTRRSFIDKPIKKLILVDHNEVHQSVPGASEAEILEILDHHRFAAEKTDTPIYIASRPVGSTSTIVYQHYRAYNCDIPRGIAVLLLSGIISDTVNLKSPTTTVEDRQALQALSAITGLDKEKYAMEMFSQLKTLKERNPEDIITSDFKTYEQNGILVGIGQVEVISLNDVKSMADTFHNALNKVAENRSLHWTMLLITDVIKQNSILISSTLEAAEKQLSYQQISAHSFDLPRILSRKKQVLPEVLRILKEVQI